MGSNPRPNTIPACQFSVELDWYAEFGPWGLPAATVVPGGSYDLPNWAEALILRPTALATSQIRWLVEALCVAKPGDATPRLPLVQVKPILGALAPYLAFKSLVGAIEAPFLFSPSRPWPWAYQHVDGLGFCHAAHADRTPTRNNTGGIYAATAREAMHYGGALYLVAPPPDATAVVGESGWRASAAYVAAGPLDTPQRVLEAAATIVAAAEAGMPQCDGILAEARRMVGETQVFPMLMSAKPLTSIANEFADRATDDPFEVAQCAAEGDLAPLGQLIYQRRWEEAAMAIAALDENSRVKVHARLIPALAHSTSIVQTAADARGVLTMLNRLRTASYMYNAFVLQTIAVAAAEGDEETAVAFANLFRCQLRSGHLATEDAVQAIGQYVSAKTAQKIALTIDEY